MTEAQVIAKFRNLASRSLPSEDVAKIEAIVWSLERATEMTTLSKVLRGDSPRVFRSENASAC